MATNPYAYISFPGIAGGVKVPGYVGWAELEGFRWSAVSAVDEEEAGEGPSQPNLVVTLKSGRIWASLCERRDRGGSFGTVRLACGDPNKKAKVGALNMTLIDVTIANMTVVNATCEVELSYRGASHSYSSAGPVLDASVPIDRR